MRIRRLDLLRHGHFTDRTLGFEGRDVDLHIVFGANEAGKSTARAAISDFLFGFEAKTPHGFRHEYRQLLVGAVLESADRRFEARRRKGTKDTLLRADGSVLEGGEAGLRRLLGGVDRAFFERMFSLDQKRLRDGGDEILREQGNAARTLFAASAGLGGLRETAESLEREADGLWGPRRAGHRRFTQVQQRMTTAQQAIREHTLSAGRWETLREAVDSAEQRLAALTESIAAAETERRRLSRVRRVRNAVNRLEALVARRATLGDVAPLPPDARARLDGARSGIAAAAAALRELDADLAARNRQLATLQIDEAALAREDAIAGLLARRGAADKARADLPGLRRQLRQLHESLARHAAELEWPAMPPDAIVSRAPARPDVARARELVEQRAALERGRTDAQQALIEAEDLLAEASRKREALGPVEDFTALGGHLSAARLAGDLDDRIEALDRVITDLERRLARTLRGLRPAVTDVREWLALPLPTLDEVRAIEASTSRRRQDLEALEERIATQTQELSRAQSTLRGAERSATVVSSATVAAARAHRDAGWSLVVRQFVSGPAPDPQEVGRYAEPGAAGLAETYAEAVRQADVLADRRFEGAEAAGRLAELMHVVEEKSVELQRLQATALALREQASLAEADWLALWKGCGITPLDPGPMLGWLQARDQARGDSEELAAAQAQRDRELARRTTIRTALLHALASLGIEIAALAGEMLRPVVEAAAAAQRRAEERNGARERLDLDQARAAAQCARRQLAITRLETESAAWLERWTPLAAQLGLGTGESPEVLRARLESLDALREDAARAAALAGERIDKIERDLDAFALEVRHVVDALDPSLEGLAPEEAVARLGRRLTQAQETRRERDIQRGQIEELSVRSAARERERARHQQDVDGLLALASAASIEDLEAAMARTALAQTLEREIAETRTELAQQGDGMTEEELGRECAGIDLDRAAASEQALEGQLASLRSEQSAARDVLGSARRDLESALGGRDTNAEQAALNAAAAELRGVAEAYLRVNTARLLLRWALERFRREQQGPLLRRAGELFRQLSDGSFEGLETGYDETDEAQLLARRAGGGTVEVDGLSEGTRDQLYLALRIASVEQQLAASAEAMPFVADDLFVNFDDGRTRAGLRVLAGLARSTQVLVFTHHAHLVELARSEVGESVDVVLL